MRRFATVLTVLLGLFPLTFGVRFLFDGPAAGAGYGITAAAGGFFVAKGIRDIVLGLNLLALFALKQRRATGVLMAITTLVPIVDMITVLSHGGTTATALGVHGLTALVMLVDASLLLRERRTVEAVEAAQPVGAHS